MTRFCIKTNTGKQETLVAMKDLLTQPANLLVLAYGYISSGKVVIDYRDQLIAWLKKSSDRELNIYVGVLGVNKEQIDDEKVRLRAEFEKIFPNELYRKNITNRIHVYAIYDFHCKFALALKKIEGAPMAPLAGIIGSSNLTVSALTWKDRFEFDLYIEQPDQLLTDFLNRALELLDLAERASWNGLEYDIRDRIYERPTLLEELQYEQDMIFRET